MGEESATGKSQQEIASQTEPVPWRKSTLHVLALTKRVLAIGVAALTVYVTLGCMLFGEWWFRLLWGGEFNWHYVVADGLKSLLDDYFPQVITIVLAACAVFILGSVFKAAVFRFVDRFAGRMVLTSVILILITALVIYHTEKWQYDLQDSIAIDLMTLDSARKYLAASNSPPHVVPPVDFQYIDKSRVDELYNQIEPDLSEKERTVAKTNSAKGKMGVSVSGAMTAEAEAGQSESSTSSFARTTFSTERKGVELMNYVVDNRAPKYYTSSREWFLGRENAALALQLEHDKTAPLDPSRLKRIKPLGEPPTEEEQRESEQKAQRYQSELLNELESLNGYVFLSGEFDRTVNGDTLILTETFLVKPHKVIFRINVPKSKVPEFQHSSKLRLRMFGDTVRPLSDDGYVDVRLIAAY
jgi:hypothetical protein